MQHSDENLEEFFEKVKNKVEGIKALVKEYGFEDNFVMSYIGGIYVPSGELDTRLLTQVDFVVEDEEELDELLAVQVDLYRMVDGMTANEKSAMPTDLDDTSDWTSDDWMKFISKNTNGESN
jgi:hypothetical protein